MLGSLRLLLAIMVAINHLWNPLANLIGAHALITFYMISGYLITLIINETYKGWNKLPCFIVNRALRIYPCYFFILILTLIGLLILPLAFQTTYSTIQIPVTTQDWLRNISLFFLYKSNIILVPPAWTLGIELSFYIVIALIGRYKNIVILWFAASLAWHIYLVSQGASFSERYTPPAAASLFFSTGAMIYWFKRYLTITFSKIKMSAAVLLFVFLPPILNLAGMDHTLYGYYICAILGAIILAALINPQQPTFISSRTADKLAGDLAYPIYLFHYFSAGLLNAATLFLFGKTAIGSTIYCLVCLLITFTLSFFYLKYIDVRTEKIRNYFRRKALGAPQGKT